MAEQKKKQVSIAAFFSPKPGKKRGSPASTTEDGAATATPPQAQAQAQAQAPPPSQRAADAAKRGKRPRASPSSAAVTPTGSATVTPPAGKPATGRGGAESTSKAAAATGKRSAAAAEGTQQPPSQQQQQPRRRQQKRKKAREPKTRAKGKVLFSSPHELEEDEENPEEEIEVAVAAAAEDEDAPAADDARAEEESGKDEAMEVELTPAKRPKAAGTAESRSTPASAVKGDATAGATGAASLADHAIDLTDSPARPPRGGAKAPTGTAPPAVQDLTQDAAAAPGKRPRGRPRGSKPPAAKAVKASASQAEDSEKAQSSSAGDSKSAAAAAATPPEAVVLDPAVQARVDTYRLKLRDLTRVCAELLSPSDREGVDESADGARDAQRALQQDVYGVGLDVELDVSTDEQEMTAAVADAWAKWSSDAASASPAAAAGGGSELPHAVKAFIAKHIQGRSATLSALCDDLTTRLRAMAAADGRKADEAATKRAALAFDLEIKMLAQRTPYGAKPPPRANVFEDTTPEALWVWEIGNPERFYKDEAHKTLKRVRRHRKRVGQQLKSLARVVRLLHQSPVDEAKVSAEEAKVGKFVLAVEAEMSRSKDRERKELERAQAAEEKKHAKEEKKHAKEEEKKQREEAERELAIKRKKSLVSYFRSIDTESAPSSAAAVPTTATSVASEAATSTASTVAGVASNRQGASELIEVENLSETMTRMDAAIAFLHRNADASASVPSTLSLTYPWKEEARSKSTAAQRISARGSTQSWTSKRRRDPKRGVMKLLQFHENTRPAFFGTFGERCGAFRGGRRPLARYAKFDYSVDSDDEWEEEEPGESLSDADSDNDDSDDDNLDYGDNWLAYEDEVEYMDGADGGDGDGEDGEDEDARSADGDTADSPQRHRKRKLPSQLEQKRRKKMAKLTRLEPKVVGPFWCQSADCDVHFHGAMAGQLLVAATAVSFESPLMRRAREFELQEAERQRKKQEELARKAQQQADKLAAEEKEKKERSRATTTTPVKARKALAGPASAAASSPAATAGTPATSPPPPQPGITAWLQPQPKTAAAAGSASTLQTSGATASDAAGEDERDASDVEMIPVDE